MYAKEEIGNTNINQFIRLNNRLRANGFLSIPFLPDIASPARSVVSNRDQITEINHVHPDYTKFFDQGALRTSEKLVQTGISSQNLNDAETPEALSGVRDLESHQDKLEITPGIRKYPNDSEYSSLNTDDLRTVGSILHGIYDRDNILDKVHPIGPDPEVTRMNPLPESNKISPLFDASSNYITRDTQRLMGDTGVSSSIELSFATDNSVDHALAASQSESSENHQKLIVDGNKLIGTIHNLLYELESRREHSAEIINVERSQKNSLIEKLNLLKRRNESLEKENESLRMINRTLSEEQINRRDRNQGRETPRDSTINRLEREKQQLQVENNRLKQDIIRLQEDDDKSRDKADQFLRSIKTSLENERDGKRNVGFNQANNTLTSIEKKKILQSHYIYSIIVGFEKSISYWKLQANNQTHSSPISKEYNSFESTETISVNSRETSTEKSFFEFCHENGISTSDLMKRDKTLWSRGLCLLQTTERSELESIIRWSCRLLNISNFRNIPIQIGTLLSKKNQIKSPKVSHIFESNPSKKTSSGNNTQDLSFELHDRFYNHFKTLFDVMDDQDVIQASNSIYIQLRDLKKLFKSVCTSLSLDYKTTSVTECIKILTDVLSISITKRASNTQPQVQSSPVNSSSQHILESLKIVLDVDSNDQILPTLKQHLESQAAIILSLSKN
ncbi:hypothetical protein HWI79_3155 [Cryptosporidium felis]|nr:hypothetical protein HWI79_3155 [Cryptosporidium felis]